MIRIRYLGPNELSPALHATAEQQGRRTTVYLLDGMTAAERRSALRRLRLTARMGHCPRLPAQQLALALFADRIRTGLRRAGAVLRLHPAASTVPIMVLSGGAIAFLLFSTVSIHVLHPRDAGQPAAGTLPTASASAIAIGAGSQGQGGVGNANDPGGAGRQAGPNDGPGRGPGGTTPALAAGTGPGSTRVSGASGSGSGTTASSKSSGGTTLSGGAPPSQVTPQPSRPATSNPAASSASTTPATTPTQGGSSAGSPVSGSSPRPGSTSSGGVCLDVGPLGVCLDL